ncbi:MAG TPA: DUF6174 domain-containing protein [Roseiflexaceae bacterium]|nr:DUF6174 domain-containing protein [Roseiflexaceae bacterium]HEU5101725.1 DUF6174 domain-containing protein [Roseiflexaceae bacterium]
MDHRLVLLMLLALGLAGCRADSRHAAAQRRWEARPAAHYLLRTREDVRGKLCGQMVEVRDEQVVRILSDTCAHPTLWTVSWLFRYVERAGVAAERCARYEPGSGCVCRDAVEMQVEYDPTLGYPRTITTRQIWSAAWQDLGYWSYLARHGTLADCTAPFNDRGRRVVVRELRPLP